MTLTLRDAWRGGVTAADYEAHMAAIGQAQANAAHLADFARAGMGRMLVAGCGPGQFFDYLEAGALERWRVVYCDINADYLAALRRRCPDAQCVADDLEASAIRGEFDAACATLVLEHTDWKRVVETLTRLAPRVMIVIQVNPAELVTAVSPGRRLPESMQRFREVHPHLIDESALVAEMLRLGMWLTARRPREVADSKTMLALEFERG
ncbi:MAG TPA: class I SAM-dependent methyltransferase [Bryobacteraceae bacterium]|nr:class I SAM-dependent methyltransferase [Bryobacteraceae bacterium]HPT27076.1 class I SAM-dependent methyltransferase [Bryobacteraceae bacterium]